MLAEFVPRLALAKDFDSYARELQALIVRAHDTHALLMGVMQTRPPVGECQLPVVMRFVENQPVVAASSDNDVHPGDVLVEIDGKPVADLITDWMPYHSGSNDAARLRWIAQLMIRGPCGPASVRLRRENDLLEIKTLRSRSAPQNEAGRTHDLPGETFRLLSPELGYLKLSSVKAADAERYIESAATTKGLIIDIRNYPSEFVAFALGQLLVFQDTPFARFTVGDLSNPGAFHWGETPLLLHSPSSPHYSGKVVVLVDEITHSSAEYHALAFRAGPNAVVVGSTTSGADGNVSPFSLPGGFNTEISGIGVFYPDKRPTQRVGIVPDITVRPTIAGIRQGRDEVLEAAMRHILGADVPEAQIRGLAKP